MHHIFQYEAARINFDFYPDYQIFFIQSRKRVADI